MSEISDVPLAVMVGHDGYHRVWTLTRLPPPFELLIPRRERLSASVETDLRYRPGDHRRFRLMPTMRDRMHRWWEIYNEGRSRTPQDAFVYFEASQDREAR